MSDAYTRIGPLVLATNKDGGVWISIIRSSDMPTSASLTPTEVSDLIPYLLMALASEGIDL